MRTRRRPVMRIVGGKHPHDRKPTPERITMALDAGGFDGPEVDAALGVPEPTVDMWEAGKLIPTPMDVERLGALTGMPMEFFYQPPPETPMLMFMCGDEKCEVYDTRPAAEVLQMHRDTLW